MAWDRALLSKTQHLCVLMSGFNGVYPVLNPDGTYSANAIKASTNIQFKIGLTQRYKLGKEEARTVIRKHGLLVDEIKAEPRREVDFSDQLAACETPMVIQEDENTDPNRFDHFSLSNSLESLMNQSFMKLLQFRLTFGLNWGGAEKLLGEVEKSQNSPQETFINFQNVSLSLLCSFRFLNVLCLLEKEIFQAEVAEKELMGRIALLDPLQGLENGSPLNLPLIVICYLVRRLAVSKMVYWPLRSL
jgi:ubiquitin-conjugating enzyme E2 Q